MAEIKTPDFTLEEIQALAEIEQKMDAGEVPYVMWHGQRLAVMEETFNLLKFKSGQTISDALFTLMLQTNISILQTQLTIETMKQSAAPGNEGGSHD